MKKSFESLLYKNFLFKNKKKHIIIKEEKSFEYDM